MLYSSCVSSGCNSSRQARRLRRVGIVTVERVRRGLRDRHLLQQHGHLFERAGRRQPALAQRIDAGQHGGAVARSERLHEAGRDRPLDAAEHRAHGRFLQAAGAERDGLVGERQRVAHRAACGARQQAHRAGIVFHLLGGQHVRQMLLHRLRRHRPQVELQAAAQHRGQHLVGVGRRQHELQVFRRLLQRLEQRAEGVLGELVRLVDHEDLVAAHAGLVGSPLDQLACLVDAAVGRRVELDVVDEAVGIDLGAGLALAAGLRRDAAGAVGTGAVQALGQDARDRGLADAARAGEQVRVVQAAAGQRVAQRTHHVFLSDHLAEMARPVLARENHRPHAPILRGALTCPRRAARITTGR